MPAGRAALATALGLALSSATPAQELPPALPAPFEDGVRALKAGKLDEAEKAFRAVLAKGGASAPVHNNLGIVHQERGEHEKAVVEFREAVRLDPASAAPRILLGASLLALGRVKEARTQLERAVKIAPQEPLARLQLARTEERAGDWVGAVDQYRALREMRPDEAEYVYALGNAYLRLSEWCLKELDAVDGGQARLLQAMGHNYRVQGRPDLALKAFDRAAQADPTLPEVHLAMAQVHMEQKRWAEARREIERELQIVPESAGARALLERLSALEAGAP
ncbi:MAG TPA: tetratricopeptide repeat protein [Vicinamibacteria bacterium]|nr:tetratricopeptide repeat protein [Vicinamibacteria bacterium]